MDEIIQNEIVETNKQNESRREIQILRDGEGKFIPGTRPPGRTKGALNRYTQLKLDLVDAWREAGGKQRFLELLNGSKEDYKWAVERIIPILPKQELVEIDVNETRVVVFLQPEERKES